jgi:hypothetical protein
VKWQDEKRVRMSPEDVGKRAVATAADPVSGEVVVVV